MKVVLKNKKVQTNLKCLFYSSCPHLNETPLKFSLIVLYDVTGVCTTSMHCIINENHEKNIPKQTYRTDKIHFSAQREIVFQFRLSLLRYSTYLNGLNQNHMFMTMNSKLNINSICYIQSKVPHHNIITKHLNERIFLSLLESLFLVPYQFIQMYNIQNPFHSIQVLKNMYVCTSYITIRK